MRPNKSLSPVLGRSLLASVTPSEEAEFLYEESEEEIRVAQYFEESGAAEQISEVDSHEGE